MSHRRAVTAIFLLSGAAGLVYEVVWARQLVLVFGNTTQAISAILTGFFGGMAIGSAIGGRVADRVRRPLRLYGILELVLVVVVLVTPISFRLLQEVYRGAYGGLETNAAGLALLRFALAVAALAPATVMMGATLPTLTRHLTAQGGDDLSGAFGRLYAANTIGAIVGTLVSGFVLIELLGLSLTLACGAACSGLAGLAALALDRRQGPLPALDAAPGRPDRAATAAGGSPVVGRAPGPGAASRTAVRLALTVAFVSGLTSLAYQVLWTRLVSAGTGNSTYVFTLILGVFLLGLAIGTVLYTRIRTRVAPLRIVATGELLVAVFAVLGMALVIGRHTVGVLSPQTPFDEFLRTFVIPTTIVVLPATIALGLIFPASSGLLGDAEGHAGRHSGQLLAANTLGAICGTFVVPFFVMPTIGSPAAVGLLALVSAVLAVVLGAASGGERVGRLLPVGGGAIVSMLVVAGLASGSMFGDPTIGKVLAGGGHVYQRAEDEIADVVAGDLGHYPQIWVGGTSMTVITVDTKLMPVLPLAARPQSQSAMVIAFGMGTAYRASLIAGLRTTAVELVPSVPQMFRWFYPDAPSYTNDPNGRIVVADGRNHVDLTTDRVDIVIVDPPPPIETSGVSVISTREFYEAAHARLNPGGIMVQWVPYGETVDEFRAHVRSFASVFPHVLIAFGPGQHGTFMLGSDQPVSFPDAGVQAALARPGVVADLSSAPDAAAHDAAGWAAVIRSLPWIVDGDVARFGGDGPLVTDDRPLPEYFLLRHQFGPPSPGADQDALLEAQARSASFGAADATP